MSPVDSNLPARRDEDEPAPKGARGLDSIRKAGKWGLKNLFGERGKSVVSHTSLEGFRRRTFIRRALFGFILIDVILIALCAALWFR